jgi:hypothetical protein
MILSPSPLAKAELPDASLQLLKQYGFSMDPDRMTYDLIPLYQGMVGKRPASIHQISPPYFSLLLL